MLDIPDAERAERTKSGSLRVDNQVHWARNYLVWAGLLDGSKRGWWQLSKSGWSLPLEDQSHDTAYELFKRVRVERGDEWGQSTSVDNADQDQPPGDRGIDVEGHLRVNPVVSFRVGVQCKRYAAGNQVTPRQVRELQGALGPFDRGILITTSVFTQQAVDQAGAPGYKPIDLIDGERLVELLVEHRLGIKDVMVVDHDFFTPFH